jgi:hypothetical protein
MIACKRLFLIQMKSMRAKLFILATVFSFSIQAQQVNRCMSPEAIDYQNSLKPGYKELVEKQFQLAKKWTGQNKAEAIYRIPVVVHVVHNTASHNLPDSVIIDQIRVLNEDYGRLNPDTVNMRSDFEPVKGNPRIEFVLAQIDPQGNPTSGITRTSTTTDTFGSFGLLTGDFSTLEAVKSTADGGHDPWDQLRYLNIWVCNMELPFLGPALLGYATPPSGLPNWPVGQTPDLVDGVVIQFQAFGSNNPNALDFGQGALDVRGRTAVHEVGHYLGLRHIWGDGDCTQEDGIDDTPNADNQSNQDCDFNENTCVDNIVSTDLPDMVENYMDYSAETCQNSFTAGQVLLMHGVLENQRYDLVHNNPAALSVINALQVKLLPNPASKNCTVRIDSNSSFEIELIDVEGRSVYSSKISGGTHTLDLDRFRSGIYLVKIGDNQFSSRERLVIL